MIGLLGLVFFLLRRARRRKQSLNLPPDVGPSTHHPSLPRISPPPGFISPYEHPREIKSADINLPPMTFVPNDGHGRIHSHELDSSALGNNPQASAYQSQSQSMTPRQSFSPPLAGIIAPQPRLPAPLTNSAFQSQQSSGSQRTASSGHEAASYGFPSHETSPNPDIEGFQFQTQQQQSAGSPESQQRLVPRRMVGSPNLRVL